MNNLDRQYLDLIGDILNTGVRRGDRTGTGTISKFHKTIDVDLQDGFPLLTAKRTWFKGVLVEFLWFLRGDTNIKYLLENGVHIWDEWPYKEYVKFCSTLEEPDYEYLVDDPDKGCVRVMTIAEFADEILRNDKFARRFGDVGPVYGKQWVDWNGHKEMVEVGGRHIGGSFGGPVIKYEGRLEEVTIKGTNQIQQCIDALKNNPESRRIMVNAWNVGEISKMMLPPCHYGFQFYSEPANQYAPGRKLSLLFNMRSVDSILGMPFDIASYGLMLTLMSHVTGHVPYRLIGSFADTHIYLNHIEGANELLGKETHQLPTLEFNKDKTDIFDFVIDDFKLVNYVHSGAMSFDVSV